MGNTIVLKTQGSDDMPPTTYGSFLNNLKKHKASFNVQTSRPHFESNYNCFCFRPNSTGLR